MPISRISRTECCVGLVFSSPAVTMCGTRVTCTLSAFSVARFQLQLANGLQKRQRFDVTNGAANLDDGDVDVTSVAS